MEDNQTIQATERLMWQHIEDMDFNNRGFEGAGNYIIQESGLNIDGMKKLIEFAWKKFDILYRKFFNDIRELGDDSTTDLLWQIVANGQEFYENITLEKANEMAKNREFEESFGYSFHPIESFIEMENIKKEKDQAKNKIDEIRSGNGTDFEIKLVEAFDFADKLDKAKLAIIFPEILIG